MEVLIKKEPIDPDVKMITDDHDDEKESPSSFWKTILQSQQKADSPYEVGPAAIIKDEVIIKEEAVMPDEEMITGDLQHNLGAPSIPTGSHTHQPEVKHEADILQNVGPAVIIKDEVIIKEEAVMPDEEIITGDLQHNLGAPSIPTGSHTHQPEVKHEADILQNVGPAVIIKDEVIIKEEAVMPDEEIITGDLQHNLGAPSIPTGSHTHQPEVKHKADILQRRAAMAMRAPEDDAIVGRSLQGHRSEFESAERVRRAYDEASKCMFSEEATSDAWKTDSQLQDALQVLEALATSVEIVARSTNLIVQRTECGAALRYAEAMAAMLPDWRRQRIEAQGLEVQYEAERSARREAQAEARMIAEKIATMTVQLQGDPKVALVKMEETTRGGTEKQPKRSRVVTSSSESSSKSESDEEMEDMPDPTVTFRPASPPTRDTELARDQSSLFFIPEALNCDRADVGPAVIIKDEVIIKEEAVMPDEEMITGDLQHNLGAPSIPTGSHTHQPEVKVETDIFQGTTTVERTTSWITKRKKSSRNESYAKDTTASVPATPSRKISHKLLQANNKFVEDPSVQTYEGTRLDAPVVPKWRLFNAKAPEASSESLAADEESDDDLVFDGKSTDDDSDAESCGDGTLQLPNSTSEQNGRKGHACYYCYKIYTRMDRHLPRCHSGERDVVRFTAMEKNSKVRTDAITLLTRKGDYFHNLKILVAKSSEPLIIVTHTQTSRRQNSEYGPCPGCLGFFIKEIIWKHIRSCPASNGKLTSRQARKLSTSMLIELRNPSTNEAFTVCLRQLREDRITALILEDSLIMKCGLQLFESKGASHSMYVRQKMRQLGRLLFALREISTNTPNEEASLQDFINPEKFDLVVAAVHTLCGAFVFDGRTELTKTGLALHLGHSLRKCTRLVRGMGIRLDDKKMTKKAKRFLNLLEYEWDDRISGAPRGTLAQRKRSATEMLPLTHDLICFNRHLKDTMNALQRRLHITYNIDLWLELTYYTLARLVLFNKRRTGEASRMRTTDYNSRKSWKDANISKDIAATLTTTEQRVASQQQIIEMVGKNGRTVPIILTAEVAAAMELIMQLRTVHNIQIDNHHFFVNAKRKGTNTYIRGHDAIAKCMAKADLLNPELLIGSNMKKYTATVCQLLDLQPAEQRWLIKHLGQSEAVYDEYEDSHNNAAEMAKVSALLVAVDEGHVEKFAGKSLGEIILEEIPFTPQEGSSVPMQLDEPSVITPQDAPSESLTSTSKFSDDDSDSEADEPGQSQRSDENYYTRNHEQHIRRKWTHPEKNTIVQAFRTHIKHGALPGKDLITDFLLRNPLMKKTRTWKDIKNFVRNFNVSCRRRENRIRRLQKRKEKRNEVQES